MYAPPWEGSESDVADRSFDDDEFDSSSSANKDEDDEHHHRAALKSLISRTEASEAMLARLAVAFSPASRSLDLRDIEHVQLLEVDNKHLDIQAVVCEDDGCVTLKVPVTFPVPCLVGDADVEEEDEEHCVLDNLQRLDLQAQETIRKLEWNELHHEDVAAEHRMHRELLREATGGGGGDDALHFPTWWVHLSSTDDIMRRECDSLRKLLNDDEFRSAVASMATQAMDAAAVSDDDDNDDDEEEEELSSMSYDDFHVTQAVVAAVCPKGLLLRAAVAPLEILGEHSHDNARGHVLEIPIQFSTNAANTADELQSAVLALVDAAEEYGG